jgi:hypothetical protein
VKSSFNKVKLPKVGSNATSLCRLVNSSAWLVFSLVACFIGLGYQGKDIVFTFIIEYSSLKDFGPYLEMVTARESSSKGEFFQAWSYMGGFTCPFFS